MENESCSQTKLRFSRSFTSTRNRQTSNTRDFIRLREDKTHGRAPPMLLSDTA